MTTDTVNDELTPEDTPATLTAEEFQRQMEAAQEAADELQASINQREWLLIRRALDLPRKDIILDGGTRLTALAWVKASRLHGGAPWDQFLKMTDDELMELHGFPTRMPDGDDVDIDTDGKPQTVREEEARLKAEFCLRLAIAPSEYDLLNDIERLAFREEAERIIEARKNGDA